MLTCCRLETSLQMNSTKEAFHTEQQFILCNFRWLLIRLFSCISESYLEQSIQEWTKSKIYGRQHLKKIKNSTSFAWSILEYFVQFSTLSNIFDGTFCENIERVKAANSFRKKLLHRRLTGFWICYCRLDYCNYWSQLNIYTL